MSSYKPSTVKVTVLFQDANGNDIGVVEATVNSATVQGWNWDDTNAFDAWGPWDEQIISPSLASEQ